MLFKTGYIISQNLLIIYFLIIYLFQSHLLSELRLAVLPIRHPNFTITLCNIHATKKYIYK